MLTFLGAGVFSFLLFVYSEGRESAESCFLGYSSAICLDLLTSSGFPVFFPFLGSFNMASISAYSLEANTAIIALSLSAMRVKKNSRFFRPFFNFS